MSWANKIRKKQELEKQFNESLRNPIMKKYLDEESKRITWKTFACFVLISVDFMARELGFKKKRILKFLSFVEQSMGYIAEDEEYFKLLNEALEDEVGVNVLEKLDITVEWEDENDKRQS